MRRTMTAALVTGTIVLVFASASVSADPNLEGRVTELEQRVSNLEAAMPTVEPTPQPTTTPPGEPSQNPAPTATPEPTTTPATGDLSANLLTEAQTTMRGEVGWTAQGNTTVRHVNRPSIDPLGALEITVSDDGPHNDDSDTARVGTPQYDAGLVVKSLGVYSGVVSVKSVENTSASARCEVRWFGPQGSILKTDHGTLQPLITDWTELTCLSTAPERASHIALRVFLDNVEMGQAYTADAASLRIAGSEPVSPPVIAPVEPEPVVTSAPAPPGPSTSPGNPSDISDFPTSATTGVVDEKGLNPSGSVTADKDGQVIENVEIDGSVVVEADNVTIRNVRIHSGGARYGIQASTGHTGLLVENVEIDGGKVNGSIGIYGKGFTLRRADIHGYRTGIMLIGSATVEGNYVHDHWYNPAEGTSHGTGMSVHGGTNIVIRDNNLKIDIPRGSSSALSLYGAGPLNNILIEHNLFNGGAYCTMGGNTSSKPYKSTNTRYVDNHFGTDVFPECGRAGPVAHFDRSGPGNAWTGNVWADTGKLIP